MVVCRELVKAGGCDPLWRDAFREEGVECRESAMDVAAYAAVAEVGFQRQSRLWDGDGEVNTFAVALPCECFCVTVVAVWNLRIIHGVFKMELQCIKIVWKAWPERWGYTENELKYLTLCSVVQYLMFWHL
jgi:hypothetical protein